MRQWGNLAVVLLSGCVGDSSVIPPADGGTDSTTDAADANNHEAGCSCPSNQTCDQFGQCIDPSVLDNFATCTLALPEVAGRNGVWYSFASPAVGTTFQVALPPTSFADNACGAWITGGASAPTNTDFAGIGATLNGGSTYSIAGHTGLILGIETSKQVTVQVKLLNGYEFGAPVAGATGEQTLMVPFSSFQPLGSTPSTAGLDLTQVTDVQVEPDTLMSFGYAVHLVALY